jgi:hypothetical protein
MLLYLLVERGVELRHYIVLIEADTLSCKFHICKGIETFKYWLRLRLFKRWLLELYLCFVDRIECAILGRNRHSRGELGLTSLAHLAV